MTPTLKYTIEIFDVASAKPDTRPIGFRIVNHEADSLSITDADYLVCSLTDTLSKICQTVPAGKTTEML